MPVPSSTVRVTAANLVLGTPLTRGSSQTSRSRSRAGRPLIHQQPPHRVPCPLLGQAARLPAVSVCTVAFIPPVFTLLSSHLGPVAFAWPPTGETSLMPPTAEAAGECFVSVSVSSDLTCHLHAHSFQILRSGALQGFFKRFPPGAPPAKNEHCYKDPELDFRTQCIKMLI